jgi:hypothetical protein
MEEVVGEILTLLAFLWAIYLAYAIMTVVRHIKIISHETRRTADAVDRIEDMMIEEFAE